MSLLPSWDWFPPLPKQQSMARSGVTRARADWKYDAVQRGLIGYAASAKVGRSRITGDAGGA